jgi:enamine deaminase RidA (YjgF/YER057c/UK114 family)
MRTLLLSLSLLVGCASRAPARLTHVQPGDSFSQATRVELGGGVLIFVSGQVAVDARGEVVGRGDMGRQTEQDFENLRSVLAEQGAGLTDIAKLTIFVTDIAQRPPSRPSTSATCRAASRPARSSR